MKIALAAVGFITNDTAYNFEKIEKLVKEYFDKVDLILFGESFLQGFDCLSWKYLKDLEIAIDRDSEIIKGIKSEKYWNLTDEQKALKSILDQKIGELNFSVKLLNVLKTHDVVTIKDLIEIYKDIL